MLKKVIASIVVLTAVGVIAQETAKWVGGGQMYANMVKNGPYMGGSALVITPEVLTSVGTNASLTEGKFYALQPGGNWTLADSATIDNELVGYSHGETITEGVIINGILENSTWTNYPVGTVMYVSATAGVIADSDPSYVRQVGIMIGEGILRLSAQ